MNCMKGFNKSFLQLFDQAWLPKIYKIYKIYRESNIPNPIGVNYKKKLIHRKPHKCQDKVFSYLMLNASKTKFGIEHYLNEDSTYEDYKKNVPIRDYDDYQKYLEQIFAGKENVLWPGKPIMFARTSASTGMAKYIPVTKESASSVTNLSYTTVMQYMYDTFDLSIFSSGIMNLTGSPKLDLYHGFEVGSISGISRKNLPNEIAQNALPSKELISSMVEIGWDEMLKKASKEAVDKNIAVCTGLPSWISQFFSVCCNEYKTQDLSKLLPKMRLLCTSGVSYKPYIQQFNKLFNNKLTYREMYSATEGGFAYSDGEDEYMLLDLLNGVFYEFINLCDAHAKNPLRFSLKDVEINKSYVPIISTNSGLWAYRLGDIIKFTSIKPYRISLVGRTQHFISIVSESVYTKNVEDVLYNIVEDFKINVTNFTVAPSDTVNNAHVKPYYEWFIETPDFQKINMSLLTEKLDFHLKNQAPGYKHKRELGFLGTPKVQFLKEGALLSYLKQKDKSSLQLKVPKVNNDRDLVNNLITNNSVINLNLELNKLGQSVERYNEMELIN